jgi:hypothetical protein
VMVMAVSVLILLIVLIGKQHDDVCFGSNS